MIIADTSGLLALFNSAEPTHAAVIDLVADVQDSFVVSPYVIAELDHLVATRIGVSAELAVLDELASGAYELPTFDAAAIRRAREVIERYDGQEIGLADASLVVLADRYDTKQVLTLDHRHFGVIRPLSGGRFRLLP